MTAIELMPVHHFASDRHLVEQGLDNYWGYNSIGFFAPHVGYTSGADQQVTEFKSMVRTFHRAGIEVILDVVYNHTAEGNQLGPTLSLRGVDNSVYYRLMPDDPRYYLDYTGTGNSLNTLHPRAMGLVTDSLRYWVTEMHVDGFRFDLAPRVGARRDRRDAERLLRDPPARSHTLESETDRGTMGRESRRVSNRVVSRRVGPSGMARFVTACASSGAEILAKCRNSPRDSPAPATSFHPPGERRTPVSTLSPATTASL